MPGLIFDYDGLIVDSERLLAECIVEVLAELGATVAIADFGHLFGSIENDHEWERLLSSWLGRDMSASELDELVGPRYDERRVDLAPLPGVAELVREASSAGWRIGLATGNKRSSVLVRLDHFGLAQHFHAVAGREDVAAGKPAPDIFLRVAEELQTAPGDCIVLEDSLPGCTAALAAGMRVVVCPSVVSQHCEFPVEVRRVTSLLDVRLDEFV